MSGQSDEARVWKEYQTHIRETEMLQTEIMKGAKAGESLASLLLKCARALSLATGSDTFCEQVERSLQAVYGEALGDKGALTLELEAARCRLEKIRGAQAEEKDPELHQEMELAIRAHEERITYLERRLIEEEKKTEA